MIDQCPLCERVGAVMSAHHVIPKSLGGKHTEWICSDCHNAIHAKYSNKELAVRYYSLELLQKDEELQRAFKFLAKQDPQRRYRNKRSNARKRR